MNIANFDTNYVLRVIRNKNYKNSTIGVFSLVDAKLNKELITGYTLEPAGPGTTIPNLDRRIPQGKYNAEWSYSPSFKQVLPLIYSDKVSKTRRILIHAGNTGSDTEGCIILGSSESDGNVWNSRAKFAEFKKLVYNQNFKVLIINNF